MAGRERRVSGLARDNAHLGKKTASRAIYCSFLFSLLIHTLFLLYAGQYAGQPKSQPYLERQIKVDLVALKVPSSQSPLKDTLQPKSIPRPYVRSSVISRQVSQFPQTQEVRTPTEYQSLKPIFSRTQALPLPKPLIEQKTTDLTDKPLDRPLDKPLDMPLDRPLDRPLNNRLQEDAAGEITVPSPGPWGTAPVNITGNMTGNVTGQVAGAAGQLKNGGGLSHHLPMKIKATPDRIDPGLAFQGYQQVIRQHIERHKKFPSQASEKGWEGSVSVRFLLRRDGLVDQVLVSSSSAIALLDEAAIRAVKDGNPFPPFPEGIPESSVWFEVPLVFELR